MIAPLLPYGLAPLRRRPLRLANVPLVPVRECLDEGLMDGSTRLRQHLEMEVYSQQLRQVKRSNLLQG